VSRRAQPEPEKGADPADRADSAEEIEAVEPGPASPDNTVTTIMPVIAPWPKPGHEPPAPPSMRLPVEPSESTAQGRAAVPGVESSAEEDEYGRVPEILDVIGSPGTALVLARRPSTDLVRSGPTVLAEDSWDDSAVPVSGGSRQLRMPSRRVWIAIAAVLVGLGSIAAVPFALTSAPEPAAQAEPSLLPTELDEPPPGFVPASAVATTPVPMSTGRGATPAPKPSSQVPVVVNSSGLPTTEPNQPAPPPPFEPLTIEAESGDPDGSAWVWDGYPNASGGLIVRNLGDWGGTPGTLTLAGIVFPNQADYTITIHFVHPNGEQNRSATVTVSGVPGVTVNFTAPNSNCCYTQAVTINIPAGTRSITVANPTDHSPSIDRIVIVRV
jgi:hypothetical protein